MNKHTWNFKKYFRKGAFGWKGTTLATKRLKEAVSEIKKVNKTDPFLAGDGCVILMECLYPALEHIDGSSGALGSAVDKALNELIPILIDVPAIKEKRKRWLEQIHTAILNDGVQFLSPVEESWGKICVYPDLLNEWADRLIPEIKEVWSGKKEFQFHSCTDICLSCLLESRRYDELENLLALRKRKFWPYDKFQAEALRRQGRIAEALSYADSIRSGDHHDSEIMLFCESLLIQSGLKEEAYKKYGLNIRDGRTYLSQFKAISKKYPEYSEKKILLDLINQSDNKAAWFASARQAGFLDIALECANSGYVDVKTLIRAGKDTIETETEFSMAVSLRAIELLLMGYGYEITNRDVLEAGTVFIFSAKKLGKMPDAVNELKNLLEPKDRKLDKFAREILQKILDGLIEN
ncbi:MAG: hypothetical protein AB1454_00045 [Candidatus Auribacterota bacterium]